MVLETQRYSYNHLSPTYIATEINSSKRFIPLTDPTWKKILGNQITQLLFYNLSKAGCEVLDLLAQITLQAMLYHN